MSQKKVFDEAFKAAFKEARLAYKAGEIPVGAVIVKDGIIISKAHNLRETKKSPTAHAEILAIEKAAKVLGDWRLTGCELYVTLEPCTMCSGAIINSRIKKVFFSAYDYEAGSAGGRTNVFDESFEIYGGLYKEEAENLLKDFFADKRKD
ncbi:MAG: nucleoside deaminase [Bacillota bacterium]|nr:nucleoside deaminase [Bacillota bacterium]